MSEPRTVKLSTPVAFGKETVEELTFRRGQLRDLKGVAIPRPSLEDLMLVASRLAGRELGVIERLDEDDAGRVMEIASDFFARCLSTGETSPGS